MRNRIVTDDSWSKEFEEKFVFKYYMGSMMGKLEHIGLETNLVEDVKSFISHLLFRQKQELLKEVEEMIEEMKKKIYQFPSDTCKCPLEIKLALSKKDKIFNQALSDLQVKIKEMI